MEFDQQKETNEMLRLALMTSMTDPAPQLGDVVSFSMPVVVRGEPPKEVMGTIAGIIPVREEADIQMLRRFFPYAARAELQGHSYAVAFPRIIVEHGPRTHTIVTYNRKRMSWRFVVRRNSLGDYVKVSA